MAHGELRLSWVPQSGICSGMGIALNAPLLHPTPSQIGTRVLVVGELHHGRSIKGQRRGLTVYAVSTSEELPMPEEEDAIGELKSISDFTRFCDKGDGGGELQTAVVSYQRPRHSFPWSFFQPKQQVALVAAVHIADKEYFEVLQKELDMYGCVLYEMVADKSSWNGKGHWKPKIKSKRRKFSILGTIQSLLARFLSMNFQLDCIDYQKDNWYHADLDYDTFRSLQREKGENFFSFTKELTKISVTALTESSNTRDDLGPWKTKLLWAARVLPMPLVGLLVIEGVCAPPASPLKGSPEVKALLNLDFTAAFKLFLAKQLTTDFAGNAVSLLQDSVIIGERNRVAMEELQVALDEGCEKIAIFYGSGHLPDMDRRLRNMGFYPFHIQWRTAWSIKGKKRSEEKEKEEESNKLLRKWPLNRYQTIALVLVSTVLAVDLWFWELFIKAANTSVEQLLRMVVRLLDSSL